MAEGETLTLSFRQIDDYQTCPLKYKYIHRLRCRCSSTTGSSTAARCTRPCRRTSARALEGQPFSEDDVVAAFRAAWVSEGFLSREHEEQRLRAGEEALRRFHREEARRPLRPTGVEQEFAFFVGADARPGPLRPRGRARGPGHDPRLQDGRRRRSRRSRRSARRRACSSTSTRWPTCGRRAACRTGSSCASSSRASPAGKRPTLEETARTEDVVREVSAQIRQRAVRGPARRTWPAASARSATSVRTPRATRSRDLDRIRGDGTRSHLPGAHGHADLGRHGPAGGDGHRLPRRRSGSRWRSRTSGRWTRAGARSTSSGRKARPCSISATRRRAGRRRSGIRPRCSTSSGSSRACASPWSGSRTRSSSTRSPRAVDDLTRGRARAGSDLVFVAMSEPSDLPRLTTLREAHQGRTARSG